MNNDPEISPEERYELMKLRTLNEVQGDLTIWAKQRVWLLLLLVTLVAFFGVGNFISATVGQSIAKEMETVNTQINAAVKSSIEADASARQATKAAETENLKIVQTATNLRETLERVTKEALETEKQLKSLASHGENIRDESRLLTNSLEQRIANLEKNVKRVVAKSTDGNAASDNLSSSIDQLTAKAKQDRETFFKNSKYEIQIGYTEKNTVFAKTLEDTFRKQGFVTTLYLRPVLGWTGDIEKNWGVPETFVGNQVTVLSPPDNDQIGKLVAEFLRTEAGIKNLKIGTDKSSKPEGSSVGVLIPPGYTQ
jgi:hypothetical protein